MSCMERISLNWSDFASYIHQFLNVECYTVEPRYKEVGYNKTFL